MTSSKTLFVCVSLSLLSYYGIQGSPEVASDEVAPGMANINNSPLPTAASRRGAPPQCYNCIDCRKVNANTTLRACPYPYSKCIEYVELYGKDKYELYVRGCVLDRGTCADIAKVHEKHDSIQLLRCAECYGDKCNSNGVARSLPHLAASLFFLIVTPLVTKYTFS